MGRPVWAEVNLSAVSQNVKLLRRHIKPNARLMAIVKANGYGHGAVGISRAALDSGADSLGVALVSEAVELRKAGFGVPLLVLGYTPFDFAGEVVDWGITQTVYTLEQAEILSHEAQRRGRIARIHVKIDTGMGRIGFLPTKQAVQEILDIARLPRLEIEGIYSHLAAADEEDKSYTLKQLEQFLLFNTKLKKEGLEIPLKHIANSAAAIDMSDTHLDLVRTGISIYGLYPSKFQKEKINLKPALSWKTRIAYVKSVSQGTGISYGCTHVTSTPSIIASLPLGYADGYSRKLSNRGQVLVGGRRVPVVGRVCMDQMMIDVTGMEDVKIGDETVLIGNQGEETISADDMAGWLDTINYEIVCMISTRVPRRMERYISKC